MKMVQRIISGLLAMCLTVSMLPMHVWAEEIMIEDVSATEAVVETTEAEETVVPEIETTAATEMESAVEEGSASAEAADSEEEVPTSGMCGENLTWFFDEVTGTLTISGSGAMTDYNGSWSPWSFDFAEQLGSVVIQPGVTSIGNGAFDYCYNLSNVTIPEGVTRIGEEAFRDCTSLWSIELPDSITDIGWRAFWGCGLGSIAIPRGVTILGDEVFSGCGWLTSVYLPEGLTSIGGSAFDNCSSLAEIVLPDSVLSIGGWAFKDCSNLVSINIPNGVTAIADSTFDGCHKLNSITLPDGCKYICEYAFYDCFNLESISLPDDVRIEEYAFAHNYNLCSVTFQGDASIGDYAFLECGRLDNVVLPDTTTGVGYSTFSGCSNLHNITIPDSVTYIGDNAFSYCVSLESITLPRSLETIDSEAFLNCTGLTEISIPASTYSLGYDAFSGCSSLGKITFLGSAPYFEEETNYFEGVTANVYYPANNHTWTQDVRQSYGGNLTWIPFGQSGTFDGHRYVLLHNCTTWEEAKTNCERLGGHLATITSEEENDFLYDYITSQGVQSAYFGLSDAEEEGTWVWVTGEPFVYSNWHEGEPNNETSNEHYGSFYYQFTDGTWNDGNFGHGTYNDGNPVYYICEFDSAANVAAATTTFNGNTYELYDHSMTWTEAKAFCEEKGGHLVTITSAEEQAFIETFLPEPCTKKQYWIGLSYIENTYQWVTNESFSYSNWDVYEPNRSEYEGAEEAYIHIYNEPNPAYGGESNRFKWNDMFVDNVFPGEEDFFNENTVGFICEYEPSETNGSFNKSVYHADYLLSDCAQNLDFYMEYINTCSPTRLIIGANDLKTTTELWSDITLAFDTLVDGDALVKYAFKQVDIYETILLNALESSISSNTTASWALAIEKNTIQNTKKITELIQESLKLKHNWDLATDTKISEMTPKEKAAFKEAFEESLQNGLFTCTVEKLNELTKYLDVFLDVATTVEDLYVKAFSYGELWQLTDSMAEVLDEMYKKTPDDVEHLVMRNALSFCSEMIRETSEEQFVNGAMLRSGFNTSGSFTIQKGISCIWKVLQENAIESNPELAILLFSYKAGKTIVNFLCNTDDIAEQTMKLYVVNEYAAVLNSAIVTLVDRYERDRTATNADILINGLTLRFGLSYVDCDISSNYADAIDEAMLYKIEELIRGETGKTESLKAYAENAESNFRQYCASAATHWVIPLERDYPDIFPEYANLHYDANNIALVVPIINSYSIECPVDVYVYDDNGDLVSSLTENKAYSVGNVSSIQIEDRKFVDLYGNGKYRIVCAGYAIGTMDMTVIVKRGQATIRNAFFDNLDVTDGIKYETYTKSNPTDKEIYQITSGDQIICADYDSGILASVSIPQDYITMIIDHSSQLTVNVQSTELTDDIIWSVDNEEIISVDETGTVTALAVGTAYVTATVTDGDITLTDRCRVDVTEEMVIEGIQLSANKLNVERYSADYATVDVLLKLPQNYSAQSVGTRIELPDLGVAIEAARFTDERIAELFSLGILDDRTLSLVPTEKGMNEAKGKYTGTVTVTVAGTEYESEAITLTVKNTLPKLKATISNFNSFYSGQSQEIQITGATVTNITASSLPSWLTLDGNKLTLTGENIARNASGKAVLQVETEEWNIPAAITLNVRNSYKAPGVKLSASSVSMSADAANSNGAQLKLIPNNKKDTLESLKVTGIAASNGYVAENFNISDGTFTLKATESAVPGKIVISVSFADTNETLALNLTVKNTAVTLKLSSTNITLNPDIGDAAKITVTAKPEDYRITNPTFRLEDNKKNDKLDSGELALNFANGVITVSTTPSTPNGATYKLYISAGGSREVSVTIKTVEKAPTMTLKATGSIDISFPENEVVVTPSFKNYSGAAIEDWEYSVAEMKGKNVLNANAGEFFEVTKEGTTFHVRCVEPEQLTMGNTYQMTLKLTLPNGSICENTVKLTIRQTALKLKLSATSITLNKTVSDSAELTVTSTTKGYTLGTPVWQLMDKTGKNSAEGKLDIAYDNGKLTVSVNEETQFGQSYKLLVKASEKAAATTLTVNIPAQNRSAITGTIKLTGGIDVIRDGSSVTVTPTYKNCGSNAEREERIEIYSSADKYTEPVTDLFEITRNENGSFTVTKSGAVNHTQKYQVKLVTDFGNGVITETKLTSLKVTMGTAKLTANADSTTMFSKDKNCRVTFTVTSTDNALNKVKTIEIKDKKYQNILEVIPYGNGEFAIGYKEGKVDSSLIGKTVTLNLNVFLEGNESTKVNGTVNLKLNFAK